MRMKQARVWKNHEKVTEVSAKDFKKAKTTIDTR